MEYHEYHLRGHGTEEIGNRLCGLGFDVQKYAGHRLHARRRS
jgi:hypothetical protein